MNPLLLVLIIVVLDFLYAREEVLDLDIAWPSGIYIDRVVNHENGEVYRFGRLKYSQVDLRPAWKNIYVVEDVLTVGAAYKLMKRVEDYAKDHGWSKQRHVDYNIRPTKDLSVQTVLNSTEMVLLKSQIAEKLFPVFKKQYGIRPSLLRIEDLFVTKYDSTSSESGLTSHSDKNPWSFVISLNEEFEGGGTFFSRSQRVWKVPTGAAIIFHGFQPHGAYRVTSGSRFILAGFCEYGNDTHAQFMSQYDPVFDGQAAAAGFRTGDLIIGLERCEFRQKPFIDEDIIGVSHDGENGQPKTCSSKQGRTDELVSRTMVDVTPHMTDEEWTALAQSCEQLASQVKTKFIVKRYVADSPE